MKIGDTVKFDGIGYKSYGEILDINYGIRGMNIITIKDKKDNNNIKILEIYIKNV